MDGVDPKACLVDVPHAARGPAPGGPDRRVPALDLPPTGTADHGRGLRTAPTLGRRAAVAPSRAEARPRGPGDQLELGELGERGEGTPWSYPCGGERVALRSTACDPPVLDAYMCPTSTTYLAPLRERSIM